MKAILYTKSGRAEEMYLGDAPRPEVLAEYLLVKVNAAAINRADVLQRQGKYPAPVGASSILGLEISGIVVEKGSRVQKFDEGDAVFGLLPGGGYAEFALIHQDMAIPKPDFLSFKEAAAIPEVFLTAYQALKWLGNLQESESVLIHAGGSGVGTAAIQLAKSMDAEIFITASKAKHEMCRKLGAKYTIDYEDVDFAEEVLNITGKRGVDVIIDFIGAPYFGKNLRAIGKDGRVIMLALLGGGKLEAADISNILAKRLYIIGSTLRSRSLAYQIELTRNFTSYALPLFANGTLKPIIDSVFKIENTAAAHQYMEADKNIGKIILEVD